MMAASFKTFFMLITSLLHWETKFGYWNSYRPGWREEFSWDCFTHCHQWVGPTFPTTCIRLVSIKNPCLSFYFQLLNDILKQLITFVCKQILPLVQKHKVLHLNKTDARLANNGLPLEIQKLRCRVNFNALRFTSQIEELSRRVVRILREKGPFLVLHLRYEMDMLAFSGCTHGCNDQEVEELTRMRWILLRFLLNQNFTHRPFTDSIQLSIYRYAYPWWKEKVIDSKAKRREGLCPLTPEETALTLSALGIDRNVQIYIAAGQIYGGEKRMASLAADFPNLVREMKSKHDLY